MSKICILAHTFREAAQIAKREGLQPSAWDYVSELNGLLRLRGLREPEVWVAQCWHEVPKKHTVKDPSTGEEETFLDYPIREALEVSEARIYSLLCA